LLHPLQGVGAGGDVPPPAQSAEALAYYLYPKSMKKWLSTKYLLITPVWS
jgi:hypothetical protein